MQENLELLKQMMSPGYDWEKHHEEDRRSFDDVFGECYHWHDYRKGNRTNKTVDCGSAGFEDTPKALYRLLWLFQPDHVDFSDMYKTGTLLDFTDPDELFLCSFQLYKYEAALYFGCPREFLIDKQEGQALQIRCGVPGADDRRCSDPLGNLFFEVATMALNFEHDVYGGNDFKV